MWTTTAICYDLWLSAWCLTSSVRFGACSSVRRCVTQVGVWRFPQKITPDAGLPCFSNFGHRISNTHLLLWSTSLFPSSQHLFPSSTAPPAPGSHTTRRAYAVIYGALMFSEDGHYSSKKLQSITPTFKEHPISIIPLVACLHSHPTYSIPHEHAHSRLHVTSM